MAIKNIPVYMAPFQGAEASIPSRVFGSIVTVVGTSPLVGIATTAALEMSFVNDGYTVLFVSTTAAVAPTLTITAVPDNAGRAVNVTGTLVNAGAAATPLATAFGPFRPLWWNFGGVVNVSLTDPTSVIVAALSFNF